MQSGKLLHAMEPHKMADHRQALGTQMGIFKDDQQGAPGNQSAEQVFDHFEALLRRFEHHPRDAMILGREVDKGLPLLKGPRHDDRNENGIASGSLQALNHGNVGSGAGRLRSRCGGLHHRHVLKQSPERVPPSVSLLDQPMT